MADQSPGTVTFLFANLEGSTRLLQRLGHRYADVLRESRRLLRTAVFSHGGREAHTEGDGCLFAFPLAQDALSAAVAALRATHRYPWPAGVTVPLRMGLHAGEPLRTETGHVALDVHPAARVCAAGHGNQILLSQTTRDLVAADVPGGVSLRDLGEHRLADLADPYRLFQIVAQGLPVRFLPPKSLDTVPNNLPRQLTSFIGREKNMVEIKRLLSSASLLTLTGPGGAGKTRLAIQVAADVLEQYRDGVWLADLASLSDPTLAPHTVASAFGVPEQPGRRPTDTLVDYLRPKSPLLVLDNCEHLLSSCADLVDALLRACPKLHVLATSREPLGLAGEAVWRVPPLSVPDLRHPPLPEQLLRYEAVRLFAQRANVSNPDFALTGNNAAAVVQVCSRLDGIPLAIELAAARVKALTAEQVAQRLDDRFRLLTGGPRKALPRHQTLRATMDWSYGLLSKPEQALLGRVSVFAGGWTVEAAEAICAGEGVDRADILDLLTQLLDKSLVLTETHRGEARYRMLETVRHYAQEKLAEAGEAECTRKRHREWCVSLAERAQASLQGREQMMWLKRLEAEHDNLRAALEGSIAEDAEAGLRLGGALWVFWVQHTHDAEGRQWLERVLARGGESSASVRARALHSAGIMATRQGDYERAATLYEESLSLSRELGDTAGVAHAHMLGGLVATGRGDYEAATVLYERGLELFRQLKDRFHTAWALAVIGSAARCKGDCAKAAAVSEESVDLFRTLEATWGVAYSLRFLGHAVRHENLNRAAELYTESLALYREVGDKRVAEQCLEGLAVVASALTEDEPAGRLFGAAEAAREILGTIMTAPPDLADHERFTRATRQRLGDECFAAAWAKGRAMTLEKATEYALTRAEGASANAQDEDQARTGPGDGLLTLREREVATLVARGLTNRQIATQLVVTERTAESHVQHILDKLGLTSRAQIAAWAVEHRLHRPQLD